MILTLVLIGGILNLILGVMILLHARLDRVSRSFSIVCFTAATLIFFDTIFRLYPKIEILQNIFAIAILLPAVTLLWVSEFLKLRWNFLKQFLIVLPAITFFILAHFNDFIIKDIIKLLPFGYIGNLGSLFVPYTLTILVYIGSSVVLLYKKVGIISKAVDLQIKYIIGGILSYSLVAIFVSLILPQFFGVYDFTLLDAPSSILFVGFTALAILKSNLFEVKVVLVEVSLVILNFFLLVNTLLSYDSNSFIFNVIIFVLVLIFSIFLLRGIYKDIRDRERIEELAKEMAATNEKLHILEQQKTEFVSIASHQLRTPLTVIKGYASMILEGTFGAVAEPVHGAMDKLYKSSERIVALVEDLLTVSRLEQGRGALHFQTADLVRVVQMVTMEIDEDIKKSNLDFSFTVEEGGEFPVSIDEKKFKQVVKHILDNAIEYTPAPGKVRIAINEDDIADKIRLSVSDTGVGMTPEQIKTIFERFNLKIKEQTTDDGQQTTGKEQLTTGKGQLTSDREQLTTGEDVGAIQRTDLREYPQGQTSGAGEKEETPNQRTPGIGLYIAQEILEAHHGTLHIASAGMNEGTTVIVELPRGN